MNLYQDQFLETSDFVRVNQTKKILVIASTPRCGSHMLGHALHQTNCFGFPLEYTNPKNLLEWKRQLNLDSLPEVLVEIKQRRTSPNGVFGIKIHYSHITQFGDFATLRKLLPDAYYVLLSRKDILKQAISWAIASQTGVWIAGQTPINDQPKYNFQSINNCLRQAILDNSSWRYTLAAHGCNYIEMDFDRVCLNLAVSIQQVADFLEIEIDPQQIPQQQVTQKQSNQLNAEWRARFLADFRADELLSPYHYEAKRSSFWDRVKNKIRNNIK